MGKVAAHMHWCEDWEFCTEYEKGDVVRRGGLLWLCLQQNAGHDPRHEFNRNYWFPFSEDSGEGTMDHESLLNRLGVGPNGETYHLSELQHKILVQVAVIPDDGNIYGIKYDLATKKYVWVPVEDGGSAAWKYYRGPFANEAALNAAHPTDIIGAYAVNLETRTFWIWGGLAVKWVNTGVDSTDIQGLPPGGVKGQVLTKKSDVDGDVEWADPTGGVAGGNHNDLNGIQGGTPTERFHLSEAGAHKVDFSAPDKPYNVSPYANEVDVTERPIFQGSVYHNMHGYGMLAYQLEILADNGDIVFDSGTVLATDGQHLMDAGILMVNTTYKWHIRYQGVNTVWSLWSDLTYFNTEAVWSSPLIAQPGILAPGNGTTVDTTPGILLTPFDVGSGTTQIPGDFEIASDSGFTDIVESGTGLDSYIIQTELTRGRLYYIRARHKGTKGSDTFVSRWSPAISILIRSLYNGTRIGIVLDDEDSFTFARIGDNYEPVDLDGGYWTRHPITAMMEATRNQVVSGDKMISLLKTYIKSGTVPRGPYKGKRCWVVDTNIPSEADVEEGWHLHPAFYSADYGEQDVLLMSKGSMDTRGAATEIAGSINQPSAYRSGAASRNTDLSDPAKRGYHATLYYEIEFVNLIILIERLTLYGMMAAIGAQNETDSFHGLYGTWGWGYSLKDGLGLSAATVPGRVTTDQVAFDSINSTGATQQVNYILSSNDAPSALMFDDYLIGAYREDGASSPPDSAGAVYYASDQNASVNYGHNMQYANGKALGVAWVGPGQCKMSKWT